MLRKLGAAVYRGLFWTYERGTWQYDVMVALILAFIFFTPRDWFHDQPVPSEASGVALMSSNQKERVYRVHAGLLGLSAAAASEEAVRKGVERILQSHVGNPVHVVRVKPESDEKGKVVGYAVWIQN
jgi:hypothetical protein